MRLQASRRKAGCSLPCCLPLCWFHHPCPFLSPGLALSRHAIRAVGAGGALLARLGGSVVGKRAGVLVCSRREGWRTHGGEQCCGGRKETCVCASAGHAHPLEATGCRPQARSLRRSSNAAHRGKQVGTLTVVAVAGQVQALNVALLGSGVRGVGARAQGLGALLAHAGEAQEGVVGVCREGGGRGSRCEIGTGKRRRRPASRTAPAQWAGQLPGERTHCRRRGRSWLPREHRQGRCSQRGCGRGGWAGTERVGRGGKGGTAAPAQHTRAPPQPRGSTKQPMPLTRWGRTPWRGSKSRQGTWRRAGGQRPAADHR